MNDEELRAAAANVVAIASRTTELTDTGAAVLITALIRSVEVNILETPHSGIVVSLYRRYPRSGELKQYADTWQAALVLAARAALKAGWLEGEGSDAE